MRITPPQEITRLSPNRSSRKGEAIDCILIHDTVSRSAESALNWVTRSEAEVSYHVIIGLDAKVYRVVPDEDRAWHAGRSELFGRKGLNGFSLGLALVDHDGDDTVDYTPEQLQAAVDWCAGACLKYRIPLNRIVGHEHVASDRKIDPGPNFPWFDFLADVARWLR